MDVSMVMRGPTPFSNYVVGGRVIVGSVPTTSDDLQTLMTVGKVDTFVCLNEQVPEYFARLKPELLRHREMVQRSDASHSPSPADIHFYHFPCDSFLQESDPDVGLLVEELAKLLSGTKMRNCIYIHCFTGRTCSNIVAAGLLTKIYRIPIPRSLNLVREYCLKGRDKHAKQSSARADSDDVFEDIAAFVRRN